MAKNNKKKRIQTKRSTQPQPAAKPAPKMPAWTKWLFIPGVLLLITIIYYWPIISAQGFLWDDFIEQNFPYRLFAATSLRRGQFPFWNPYVFSGMPFFADVQAAVLYPLNLILTIVASRQWLNPLLLEYQVVLHVFIAGLSMYALAREFVLSRAASVVAAISFMLCGFLTAHIFHINVIHTAVWFPLILFLFKRALDRYSIFYMAITALVLAAVFLAGYPQLLMHMYYVLGAYFVFHIIVLFRDKQSTQKKLVTTSIFGGLVFLSLGMSAIQFLPTQSLGQQSARPTLSFTESSEGSFRPYRFVTLLAPKFFGTPKTMYWGIAPNDYNAGAHSYWETIAYTGIFPLILAVIAIFFVRNITVAFFASLALLSFFLAMGDSFFVYWIFHSFLPGFDRFRIPARFMFMFSTSISLLAGFGMHFVTSHNWKKEVTKRIKLRNSLLIATGIIALGTILFSAGAFKQSVIDFITASGMFGNNIPALTKGVNETVYPQASTQLWIAFLFFASAATLLLLHTRSLISAKTFAILALGLVAIDFFTFGYGYAAGDKNPARVYEETDIISQLKQQMKTEVFRINTRSSRPGTTDLGGRHMIMPRNAGSVHRIFLMEGYNPLRLHRQLIDRSEQSLDILNVKYHIDVGPQGMGMNLNPDRQPRAWMSYDYVIEKDEQKILSTMQNPSFDHRHSVVAESNLDFEPQDFNPTDSTVWKTEISSYTENEISIDVETSREGMLVLSEIFYPAWKAKIDNETAPVHRVNYALRGVVVPEGTHTVRLFYQSAAFNTGAIISLLSLALTAGLIVFDRRKKQKLKLEPAASKTVTAQSTHEYPNS